MSTSLLSETTAKNRVNNITHNPADASNSRSLVQIALLALLLHSMVGCSYVAGGVVVAATAIPDATEAHRNRKKVNRKRKIESLPPEYQAQHKLLPTLWNPAQGKPEFFGRLFDKNEIVITGSTFTEYPNGHNAIVWRVPTRRLSDAYGVLDEYFQNYGFERKPILGDEVLRSYVNGAVEVEISKHRYQLSESDIRLKIQFNYTGSQPKVRSRI